MLGPRFSFLSIAHRCYTRAFLVQPFNGYLPKQSPIRPSFTVAKSPAQGITILSRAMSTHRDTRGGTLDKVRIDNLTLHLPHGLGPSAFNLSPPPPCPANLSIDISLRDDVFPSCVADDSQGGLGVDYSSLSKEILAVSGKGVWSRPEELLDAVESLIMGKEVVEGIKMELELPRASLKAHSVVYISAQARASSSTSKRERSCEIRDLRVMSLIGLREYERQQRQWLELDVRVEGYDESNWNHVKVTNGIYEWVEKSSFGTVEALVDELGLHLLRTSPALKQPQTTVEIVLRKPSALPYAVPGVSIRRTMEDYTKRPHGTGILNGGRPFVTNGEPVGSLVRGLSGQHSTVSPRVFIALGSNLGDRLGNISRAVSSLSVKGLQVVRQSRLYESEPMYHEAQDRFINAVVEVRTSLGPLDVLRQLKAVEREVGRVKTFRNGPRTLDLDLLLYGDQVIKVGEIDAAEDEHGVGWLRCPHPRIGEREFVLRPLADLAPNLVHPQRRRTIASLLVTRLQSSPSTLAPIMPFPPPALSLRLDRRPKIMQIFNATPDSFSDGQNSSTDPVHALSTVTALFDNPFPPHILDIGGQSTRPGADMVSEIEEMSRVVPLIQAIRTSNNARLRTVPISIDTFRPAVARAAIQAGASCINDVRAGLEPGMLQTTAELDVPVILMHSRGDSTSMLSPSAKDYSALGGVVEGVKAELGERVSRALEAGVKSWNIIVDPGIGFAKGTEENLALLRHLPDLVAPGSPLHGYPLLIGGSRKRFVGQITERSEPKQRMFGDAAVVGWCLRSGVVDVVRVHEGRGTSEMVKMWQTIEEA